MQISHRKKINNKENDNSYIEDSQSINQSDENLSNMTDGPIAQNG